MEELVNEVKTRGERLLSQNRRARKMTNNKRQFPKEVKKPKHAPFRHIASFHKKLSSRSMEILTLCASMINENQDSKKKKYRQCCRGKNIVTQKAKK